MTCVVAIVGPTSVGKSSTAIAIAQQFKGEIIGADSRQIYRWLDIGTAKPSPADREKVIHHLIDIIFPNEIYSVAQYKAAAEGIIDELDNGEKLALLVGGSGQYVWSVLENWHIPLIPPDADFRAAMYERAERQGYHALHAELSAIDKEAAMRIMPSNIRRVVRALEIYYKTGGRQSGTVMKGKPNYKMLIIGLYSDRTSLYTKIDKRVDDMIKQGLVEEVRGLINKGYSSSLPALSGIGYRQINSYLEGKLTLDDAVLKIKYATHRYARGQYNWFRIKDSRITWFNADDDNQKEIIYTIKTFLDRT